MSYSSPCGVQAADEHVKASTLMAYPVDVSRRRPLSCCKPESMDRQHLDEMPAIWVGLDLGHPSIDEQLGPRDIPAVI